MTEFCISFFMIKYSKFTDNIGSGNFTDIFCQNTDKFKKSGVTPPPPPSTHTHTHRAPLARHALACIRPRAKQMFLVNIKYTYFSMLFSFLCYFQKLQLLLVKNLNEFLLHCTSIFLSSKSVSQIFKILFQTGDLNIFVLCDVFLVDIFN